MQLPSLHSSTTVGKQCSDVLVAPSLRLNAVNSLVILFVMLLDWSHRMAMTSVHWRIVVDKRLAVLVRAMSWRWGKHAHREHSLVAIRRLHWITEIGVVCRHWITLVVATRRSCHLLHSVHVWIVVVHGWSRIACISIDLFVLANRSRWEEACTLRATGRILLWLNSKLDSMQVALCSV